ncbi:hypothetical protein OIV83_005460 [Microbotryomycetes sp. JL201]|nr:hypothetical protein OIV83_005460 [Microbotryomycetes sp. JL201]
MGSRKFRYAQRRFLLYVQPEHKAMARARDPEGKRTQFTQNEQGATRKSGRVTTRSRTAYVYADATSDDDVEDDEDERRKRAKRRQAAKSKDHNKTESKVSTERGKGPQATSTTPLRPDARISSTEAARSRFIGQSFSPGNGQNDYTLDAPEPWRDDDRQFRFDGHPSFLPNLSPEEVIRQGSFGGGYFRPVFSKFSKREVHDDWEDLPREWYTGLEVSEYLTREEGQETQVNKWKVKVGQSYEEWEKAGWIRQDGSNGIVDSSEAVVSRTKMNAGRWEWKMEEDLLRQMLETEIRRVISGETDAASFFDDRPVAVEIERDEEPASKGIRQTLNHWAYEPNTTHLLEFLESKGVDVANDEEAGDLL